MTTTDAEAIARIIEAEIEHDIKGNIAWVDGKRAANAILSYLASRREAQEPVARQWQHHDPLSGNVVWCEKQYWNGHRSEVSRALYTAPPAPAGEVERLRGALEIAREVHFKAASIASGLPKEDPEHLRWLHHSYGADEVAYKIDAALNGGRADG